MAETAPDIELLLFDLGGVLVDLSGPREMGQFLRAPATPDEILKRWIECRHTHAFERGSIELLDQLRPKYRLAVLGNSNELHWERNTNELKLIELFEFAISSHQLHPRAPGPRR